MFCPECGTWNRGAGTTCVRCAAALPDVPTRPDVPDALITALRQATGNRYRVLRRIGSGGMADVYLVEQETLGRPLVLKVMHAHLARDEEMRERFRREAEAAARLVHPLICVPFDYGEVGEMVYLIMPFMGGGGLADLLARQRTIPPIRVAEVSGQVATLGLVALINLAAVLSISIGMINLFPVPMLDGGHLLFFGLEALRGRPLSEKAQDIGFRIGFAAVLMLMIFATWNDIIHLSSL